jgi:RNA polymerase sigma-70 factor (ECF subfamily)
MINIHKSDQELIQGILKGNIKLFEELIHRFQKLVMSIVMRFTTNHYDREELCQEIFIKVYQNLSGFKFNSKLSTWIGKITYNHCINYVKKNSKYVNSDLIDGKYIINDQENEENQFDYLSTTVDKNFEDKEIYSLINKNVNHLPKLYQTILNLFHLQEMSYNEISEILDLPEGTVKSYLFRSRKLLKEKLLSSYKEEELI